jgi:DnaA regulatory inactivator Hda
MAQLTLDLGQRPALDREDFLVAPSNETAVAWIDRWPDWPGAALALYGPPGCGKSHLAQVWRAASGARAIDPAALACAAPPDLIGPSRRLLLDGLDAALDGDAQCERTVLHLYNMIAERGGHLLLTGRSAPARWPVALADLRSRLAAVQAVELGAADDALIQAVLVKLFADRQLRVRAEVVRFLLARMERSFAAARALVDAIDRAALESRREITVPLAREVLNHSGTGSPVE